MTTVTAMSVATALSACLSAIAPTTALGVHVDALQNKLHDVMAALPNPQHNAHLNVNLTPCSVFEDWAKQLCNTVLNPAEPQTLFARLREGNNAIHEFVVTVRSMASVPRNQHLALLAFAAFTYHSFVEARLRAREYQVLFMDKQKPTALIDEIEAASARVGPELHSLIADRRNATVTSTQIVRTLHAALNDIQVLARKVKRLSSEFDRL